ncbi:TPA: hypothetical protein N0F65_004330 [Lagenidium giganteum]|uniref:Aquaporin n=1 Tax=Lagenidium giganteum TaxID=4803 RepID=A0AAV2YLB1_9STRA|nr:TPA: hypothetical protein N0F65_004330 [Lagenidium giganteum]
MARILWVQCSAEFVGTCVQVFMGMTAIASSITTGMQSGIWQIAVIWGFAIALTIYMTAQISGGHLNPAVTLSFAVSSRHTRFPWSSVLPYVVSQVLGALCGAALVLLCYGPAISRYEERLEVTRGDANSTLSAMVFACYFPNPQLVRSGAMVDHAISSTGAFGIEVLLTVLSIWICRALIDAKNSAKPIAESSPFYIGFSVACLICAGAPLTMGCMNPARDLGPRLVASLAGWGAIAFPGPHGGAWVYTVGPMIGGLVGAVTYDMMFIPWFVWTQTRPAAMSKEDVLGDGLPTHHNAVISVAALNRFLSDAAMEMSENMGRRHASSVDQHPFKVLTSSPSHW